MNSHTPKLTQERLKKLITYNPFTGDLISNVDRHCIRKGSILGSSDSRGYKLVMIDKIHYKAHQLAFLYMTGIIPERVDHKDTNPSNNAWDNLRAVTAAQNAQNRQISLANTTGVKGLSYEKRGQRYLAQIKLDGQKYSKSFSCKAWGKDRAMALAIQWLKETREKLHGEFTNHG